jgi:hypothetical protein
VSKGQSLNKVLNLPLKERLEEAQFNRSKTSLKET